MSNQRTYTSTTTREAMARMADAMSSFDELAVSVPEMQIDLKSAYPISRLRDIITTTGGGSVVKDKGAFLLTTDSAADSSAEQRSVERGRYVAGYDAVPGLAVAVETRPVGDQLIEWGYTDFLNGMVCGEDADGMYVATYKGGVKTDKTYRRDWDQPLDEDKYEAILDPAHLTPYRLPFRYYGGGPWRLNAGLMVGDSAQEVPIHATPNPTPELPFIDDPNQPLTVLLDNNGTSGNPLTVRLAGRQFHIEGKQTPNRRVTGATRLQADNVGADYVPLVAFRQKVTGGYESISVKLEGISILSTTNLQIVVLIYSGLTGATFQAPDFSDGGDESALEYDVSATDLTNGVAVYPDIASGGGGNKTDIRKDALPDLDMPGGEENVVLAARTVDGSTAASITATFRALEEW